MKILITGGAGYIGSVLTPVLLETGHQVTVLDNFMYRQFTLTDCCQYERFAIVRGDCRDERLMKPLIAAHDIIVPLAALVGAVSCDRDKVAAQSTNAGAVQLICNLTGREQRILFPSTVSIYGNGQNDPTCTEDTPPHPISLYATSKLDAEQAALTRDNSICLRLATVFGMSPRMRLDLLVNDLVYRAMTDKSIVIFEGHFKRNYIHVRDVVRAFLHCISNFDTMRKRTYNVGLDAANLTKLELCTLIRKQLPKFVFMEAAIGEDPDKRDYFISHARISESGYTPLWTLQRGIAELIKGYTILRNNTFSNV